MKKNFNYGYIFLCYDVKQERVNKVFKVCKKYLSHFQNSVFRGEITTSKLIKLKSEIEKIIVKEEDRVCIIKLINGNSYSEENLGINKETGENLIL